MIALASVTDLPGLVLLAVGCAVMAVVSLRAGRRYENEERNR